MEVGRAENSTGWLLWVGILALLAWGAAYVALEPHPHHGGGLTTECANNLKNLGTALEMYSTDHLGRYPTRLSDVTPGYLKVLPTCPATRGFPCRRLLGIHLGHSPGTETYSTGYQVAASPDAYTVSCSGQHHRGAGVPADFPRYSSVQGLLMR